MDLTEFLLARIAEDEAAARDAMLYGASLDDFTGWVEVWEQRHDRGVDHFTRHDPSRERDKCEATRRIVEWHTPDLDLHSDETPQSCPLCYYEDATDETYPCPTLRALSLPYADHEDYRPEWKP